MSNVPKSMWAVLRIYPWGSLTHGGSEVRSPVSGSHGFCPVFNTKEDAVRFAGSEDAVAELEISVVIPKEAQ